MAAVTQGTGIPRRTERERTKPLGGLVMMLYPLLAAILPHDARKRLTARRDYTLGYHKHMREFHQLQKNVEKDARIFRQIIVERLAAMGFSWRTRRGDNDPDEKTRKRRKTVKVRVELTRFNEHAVWLKIHVRSRKLFGMKNELPYKVYVTEIVKPETCAELSFAVDRQVSSRYDDPQKGAWLIVYRNKYAGLLPSLVLWRNLLEYYPQDTSRAPMILGIGENNTLYDASLEDYPHILIGGATLSGKSNMLNCILSSLIRFTPANELRLIMIDPKKVELSYYRNAPHCDRIIYNVDDAIQALEEVGRIVDQRTDIMCARAKDLPAFNARFPDERMSRIVVVVEEMASLWDTNKDRDRVHHAIKKISSMGRAAGIHLILVTQLPVVEVVPSLIRVNMWLRIAGRTQNWRESQVLIGSNDAAYLPDPEKLRGRMCIARNGGTLQMQAPRIDDDDILESVAIANGRARGVIELRGCQPEIVATGLCRLIAREFYGAIRIGELQVRVRELGISAGMLKSWLDDLFAGRIDGFRAAKLAGVTLLIDESRLTNDPPLLMLPAPAAPLAPEPDLEPTPEPVAAEPEPEPPAPVAPEPPPRPEPTTDKEVFERFLEDCTRRVRAARTQPSVLYDAYVEWAEGRYPAVSLKKFGMFMRAEHFEQAKHQEVRYWIGISADVSNRTDESATSDAA